jgi:hypothetical protein
MAVAASLGDDKPKIRYIFGQMCTEPTPLRVMDSLGHLIDSPFDELSDSTSFAKVGFRSNCSHCISESPSAALERCAKCSDQRRRLACSNATALVNASLGANSMYPIKMGYQKL